MSKIGDSDAEHGASVNKEMDDSVDGLYLFLNRVIANHILPKSESDALSVIADRINDATNCAAAAIRHYTGAPDLHGEEYRRLAAADEAASREWKKALAALVGGAS